ncbi:MAG: Rhs element Vgr protein [Proteobacteria bacterium]|nr:Rhs element Vgr protein [Pseudomonadota bacterium]
MTRRKRSFLSIAADGQPARLDLQTFASRTVLRPFHGHITQVTRLGANGGFARYQLTLEPWPAFLGHNQDNYLFQDNGNKKPKASSFGFCPSDAANSSYQRAIKIARLISTRHPAP